MDFQKFRGDKNQQLQSQNVNINTIKQLTLFDGVSSYTLYVSNQIYERAIKDLSFATTLLHQHKTIITKQASHCLSTNDTLNNSNASVQKENNLNLSNSRTQWTTEQIRLLLHLYEKHCTALDNSEISNRTFWRYLNEGLKNKGHNFTVEQCKTKINNMKKMYKDIKDHNAQSGNDRKTCEHYEIMDNLFSKKPWIKPLSVAGSDIPLGNEIEEDEKPLKRQKVSPSKRTPSNDKDFIEAYKMHKQLQREATEDYRNKKLNILKQIADSTK
ncbi:uncharacterized protein LOC105205380 [Solenopsis invicta]|nr:uncharacterized protein LOC105205380 [Solenopsis invicta]